MAVMIEPAPAPEIFCSGLGEVELIGDGCACFVLYRNTNASAERVIVARIIAPIAAIPEAVALMMQAAKNATGAAVRDRALRILS